MTEQIALITIEYTQNDLGEFEETRTEAFFFAQVDSVTMNEFYQAGLQGFKPEYKFAVWQAEYSGEELLEYNGKVYDIYRTYKRDDGRIELYANEKKGAEDET